MSWISQKWHSLTAGSWRGLSEDDFWNNHDAVVASTARGRGGRGNEYETWTYGQLVGIRPTLEEAKGIVEDVYGPLPWRIVKPNEVEVDHVYYGPTTEFTDPVTIHVVDKLPALG